MQENERSDQRVAEYETSACIEGNVCGKKNTHTHVQRHIEIEKRKKDREHLRSRGTTRKRIQKSRRISSEASLFLPNGK